MYIYIFIFSDIQCMYIHNYIYALINIISARHDIAFLRGNDNVTRVFLMHVGGGFLPKI